MMLDIIYGCLVGAAIIMIAFTLTIMMLKCIKFVIKDEQ